ncbi:hypothetical protein PC120_g4804 [Phytophthora cactorum]|nr:hypothetical protein PC120_g4804 [Phytophthora cactorum]
MKQTWYARKLTSTSEREPSRLRRDELCTDVLWEVRDAFLVSLAVAP